MSEKENLKTERLTLKPVKADDFEIIYRILTDEFVRRYLCDDEILPREVIESFIADSERDFTKIGGGLRLIVFNESGETIGLAGLRIFFDEPQPQLLYALLPEWTGKGLATEAARKVIDDAFSRLDFKYLDASFDAPNNDSQKVAERLGMRFLKEEIVDEKPIVFYRLENNK